MAEDSMPRQCGCGILIEWFKDSCSSCRVLNSKVPKFSYDAYFGADGVPVLHVITPAEWDIPGGPRCRIYLNDGNDDGPLWANPDLPDTEEAKTP